MVGVLAWDARPKVLARRAEQPEVCDECLEAVKSGKELKLKCMTTQEK